MPSTRPGGSDAAVTEVVLEFVEVHNLMTHPGVVAVGRVDVHTSILRELHAMSTNIGDVNSRRPTAGRSRGDASASPLPVVKRYACAVFADVDGDFAENDGRIRGAMKGGLMPRIA